MWYHFAYMSVSVAMFGMTAGALVVYLFPSIFTRERTNLSLALLLAFSCLIGMGFMFIEMCQTQTLTLLLGHPIYGLSVVLFTLLLGAGIGSASSTDPPVGH